MSAGPCRYYLSQGKCFYGDECKFEHTAGAAAGSDVPAAASVPAPAAASAAPAPSKMLAAGAKAWTPSAAVGSFVPASAAAPLTVPAASATAAAPSSPPPNSKSPALSAGGLKLNPNKTPFKPGGAATAATGTAAPKLSTAVPAFVPSASPVAQSQSYAAADDEPASHQDHYADDDSYHPDVDPSHYGDEGDNPYASHHEPFGGSLMHHGDDDAQQHASQMGHDVAASAYVAPDAYTDYESFAAHSAPLRSTSSSSVAAPARVPTSQQQGGGPGLFMDDALRARFTLWSHLQVARLQPDDPLFAGLPTSLDHDRYHSLLPLPADEAPAGIAAGAANAASSAAPASSASSSAAAASASSSWYAKTPGGSVSYKAISAVDGRSYVIKRLLHSGKITEDSARAALAPWIALQAQYGSGSAPGSAELALSSAWGAGPAHPHLVPLRGLFVTKDFGTDAASLPPGVTPPPASMAAGQLCLVYDYLPTLSVLAPLAAEDGGASKSVDQLWNLFLQLLTALSALHEHNRAAGAMLQPGRVLATSDGRLRLGCMGLGDLLLTPAGSSSGAASTTPAAGTASSKALEAELAKAQASDIKSLALLMLGWMGFASQAHQIWTVLHPAPAVGHAAGGGHHGGNGGGTPSKAATAAAAAASAAQSSAVTAAYAAMLPALNLAFPGDLVALLSSLFRPETSVSSLQIALAPRLMRALTTAHSRVDHAECEVSKEMANGRLVRLLIKLGFVCDRPPDASGVPRWSETGDRYLLSLFRDLVFHSSTAGGLSGSGAAVAAPNVDWGHVLWQLNCLDAGSAEKLALSDRDSDALLVLKYSDLKQAVDDSYEELLRLQQGLPSGEDMGGGGASYEQSVPSHHAAGGRGGSSLMRGGPVAKSSLLMPLQ